MKAFNLLTLLTALLLAGCMTQAVTLSTLDEPGEKVSTEVSQFNVLGFSPLTIEMTEELLDNLNEQCGGAGVTGLTTRTSQTFAVIGQIEKIEATGYCKTE